MSDGQNNGTLVNVKRVRRAEGKGKAGNQEQLVLTFGTGKEGEDGLESLLNALEQYRGRQVNFDIRITQQKGKTGTFDSAFVIVKEMIPKAEGTTTFVPKGTASKGAQAKANSERVRKQFE
jgi:hypothetical protein